MAKQIEKIRWRLSAIAGACIVNTAFDFISRDTNVKKGKKKQQQQHSINDCDWNKKWLKKKHIIQKTVISQSFFSYIFLACRTKGRKKKTKHGKYQNHHLPLTTYTCVEQSVWFLDLEKEIQMWNIACYCIGKWLINQDECLSMVKTLTKLF